MSFFGNRRQVEPAPIQQTTIEKVPPPVPALPPNPVGFETVLGTNSVLEGTLKSNANVRLDGTFTGTLEITGNVLVGETAKITADINAKNISIAGAVRGNISGKKVQLLRTGRIWGDIRATALTTEEGAFIDGKITMLGHDSPGVEVEQALAVTEPPVESTVSIADDVLADEPEVVSLLADDVPLEDEASEIVEDETFIPPQDENRPVE